MFSNAAMCATKETDCSLGMVIPLERKESEVQSSTRLRGERKRIFRNDCEKNRTVKGANEGKIETIQNAIVRSLATHK